MKFCINGRDIFCKGANWIPSDAMPYRMTIKKYEYLLDSARKVHMNMLRVWGGGWYEADEFYNLCDEKGILVWHDFMFACMPYPAEDWFLTEVKEEVKHQVKRLKDHPCIALWCGDNEVLESVPPYVPARLIKNPIPLNMTCHEQMHPFTQMFPNSCPQHEVEVIGHQAIGKNIYREVLLGVLDQF